jgi:CHAT domain-containing protein/Tfp pilus assembly protein PilF
VADQQSRDAVLTLSDSRGRQLLKVDSLTATSVPPWPAEEIHWVADAPGTLRIDLRIDAAFPAGSRGPCGLRLVERRRATAADRRRAQAEAELARGHALRLTHKPETGRAGIAPYESAQRRFADLGLPRRRAEALLGLGLMQRNDLHDDAAALQAFTRADEPLFAGDPAFELLVRQHLGELRYELGDLDGAIAEDRRALALSRQLGNRAGEAQATGNLGLPFHRRGHYDEAASYFDRSLALWRPGDDRRQWANTLLNRGHLHLDLGELDQARKRFNDALVLCRQIGDRSLEAATLNALGILDLRAGRPGTARDQLRAALALRPPGSRGRAVTLETLGVAYRDLGLLTDARQAYTEALSIFQSLGDSREQASSLGNLGRLEIATGHDGAALGDFDRALELFRTLTDSSDIAWILEGKAWVHRSGDLEEARKLMMEALDTIERHRFSQASYNTRAEFFATRQGSYDFLIDLLMEMHREAEALEVSERSLARSLLDGLAASGTVLHHDRGGASPELYPREREVENQINGLVSRETRLTQDAAPPGKLQPIEAELARRWAELDRVRAELRVTDPRYAALTQPQPWKAAEVQSELLDRDTLLLEYHLGEKQSFVWAVAADSLKSFRLPGRAEIEHVAGPAALAGSTNSTARRSAELQLAKLSRLLLDPVAPLLPGKRLLVVGDGVLQSVPFAALPEPGGSEPLVARHEIVTLPSMSVLGEIRREVASRPRAPKTLWVLANPDFGGLIDPLRYAEQEATGILELASSPKQEILGSAASRAAVLSGALRDYRYLHFATHGVFDNIDPHLVLAQVDPQGSPVTNGFLHLADIYELNLRADLVVLSACQSALGREVRGEGMMGMTRGFFYAGAERVLVSLWNVNDRVTVELMRHFYRGILAEHLSPAAALRTAQNAIRSQERWRDPYYWAGFTLQGEWRGLRPDEASRARWGTSREPGLRHDLGHRVRRERSGS